MTLTKQARSDAHNRHKMPLNTVGDIIREQGRIYRLNINNRIKTDDMLKKVTALREIRSSIESLPPEPVVMPPTTIVIGSVPTGFSLDAESGQVRPSNYIEHQAIEANATAAIEANAIPALEAPAKATEPAETPTPEPEPTVADPAPPPRSQADREYDPGVKAGVWPLPPTPKPVVDPSRIYISKLPLREGH